MPYDTNPNPNANPAPRMTLSMTAELRHGATIRQLAEVVANASRSIDPDRGTVTVTNHQADRPGEISTTTVTFSGPAPQDEPEPPVREHRGGRVIRDTPQA